MNRYAYFSIKIKFNPYKPPSYILAWQSLTSGKFGEFESPAMGEAPSGAPSGQSLQPNLETS